VALLAAAFAPSLAGATPTTYAFTSGTVTLRAVLDDGLQTSVLAGATPVNALLGGTSVTFDPDGGPNASLLDLLLIPSGPLDIDLDEAIVGLDTIRVANAQLALDPNGSSFFRESDNAFLIGTIMSGIVSGYLAGGTPFGPAPVSSIDSFTVGGLAFSGDTIMLSIHGVNFARFAQLPGPGPDVIVKADFTFVGTTGDPVPEPGTALLLGLGLGLLAQRARRNGIG